MKFEITSIKVDAFLNAFGGGAYKFNHIIQRRYAEPWSLDKRGRFIANMLQHRPMPTIFTCVLPDGPRFAHYVLDGRQRLLSILVFAGYKGPPPSSGLSRH